MVANVETYWTASAIVAVVGLLALSWVVLSLAREIGLLLARLPPNAAKPTHEGPDLHTTIPMELLVGRSVNGRVLRFGETTRPAGLFLFMRAGCPPCNELLPQVVPFAKAIVV